MLQLLSLEPMEPSNPHLLGQVPEKGFISWLRAKQAEGYSLVGLEQMEGSVPLPEYAFSPATVLIIGREREGISEDILQVCSSLTGRPGCLVLHGRSVLLRLAWQTNQWFTGGKLVVSDLKLLFA